MAEEGYLLDAAMKLAEALNRVADDNLPGKLAGIVKLHAGIAVGAAVIPIPGADMVAAGVNVWAMYIRINKELDLPFAENVIKSLAAGAATNLAGAAAGTLVIGAALKLFPGLGTVGGAAVMGVTVYALTMASGVVYMNAVARLLKKTDASNIGAADLKAALDREMSDKSAIKDIMRSAKKDYKESK